MTKHNIFKDEKLTILSKFILKKHFLKTLIKKTSKIAKIMQKSMQISYIFFFHEFFYNIKNEKETHVFGVSFLN